jgi:hypothetical protein
MNTLAAAARPSFSFGKGLLDELLERQRTLTLYAAGLLALACATSLLQIADPRLLDGVNIWVKPTKFLVSVAVFALTTAWFFGLVRPERRRARSMRLLVALLVLSGSLELGWIAWQAAQGIHSHFNDDTPFYSLMYGLMGLFAVLLTATAPMLAWEIARRPVSGIPRDYRAAVVAGLVLTFLLAVTLGGYMSGQGSHAVGAEGGRVALFGWNRSGGDLRVAHFMSIHAQQIIPLIAAMAGAAGLNGRHRWTVLIAGTGLFLLTTLGLFAQALDGKPLFPV